MKKNTKKNALTSSLSGPVSNNGCTDDWQQELRLPCLSIGQILKSENVLCHVSRAAEPLPIGYWLHRVNHFIFGLQRNRTNTCSCCYMLIHSAVLFWLSPSWCHSLLCKCTSANERNKKRAVFFYYMGKMNDFFSCLWRWLQFCRSVLHFAKIRGRKLPQITGFWHCVHQKLRLLLPKCPLESSAPKSSTS